MPNYKYCLILKSWLESYLQGALVVVLSYGDIKVAPIPGTVRKRPYYLPFKQNQVYVIYSKRN